MRRATLAVVLVLSLPLSRSWGQAAVPAPCKLWTVDDVVRMEEASDYRISPDGRWAVWVRRTPERKPNRAVANLVLSSLTEDRTIDLTRGVEDCLDPRWSPDGKLIAFRTTRLPPGATATDSDHRSPQLWLIRPTGGEAWPLTRGDREVVSFEWASSDSIICARKEARRRRSSEEPADDTIVVEDERQEPAVCLFEVAVPGGEITRRSRNRDRIESLALSPDGRYAVTEHDRSLRYAFDNRIRPAYNLHDLKAGTQRRIFAENKYHLEYIIWAPDGAGFYAANAFTSHPRYVQGTITELYYFDLEKGSPVKVDLDWERGLSSPWEDGKRPSFRPTRDGFVASLADGARNQPARYTRQADGWRRCPLQGEHARHISGLEIGPDGRTLIYEHSAAGTPAQWYRARLEGDCLHDPVCLTRLNEHLQGKPLARTELVRWSGGKDEEVEGILYYPHDYRPGTRYPLVVTIHGGPMQADFDAWSDSWSKPANLLCQRGAFVLKPNYHGSTNYGLNWVESIAGHYLEWEVTDIEKGIDHLVARGLADPERLGLMGWSNGAILTAELTARSDRYRAAAVLAGTVEQTSDWGATVLGAAFDHYYLGKSPFADPELYVRKSSFYRLDRVRTPTLIFTGEEDRVVGAHQGWLHYRALQQTGKAPVRYLIFPGEGHALKQVTHQRRKVEEELAWFDRYLFRKDAPKH